MLTLNGKIESEIWFIKNSSLFTISRTVAEMIAKWMIRKAKIM